VTPDFIADDDDDIASHVELSSDGMPTHWYHQQEHDYLKNEMEPESSGMEGEIVDDTGGIELIENDNAIEADNFGVRPVTGVGRMQGYDSELPQDIFHKSEQQQQMTAISQQPTTTNFSPGGSLLINNFVQHQHEEQQQQQQPVMVVDNQARFNQVVVQEEQNDGSYHDGYMMDEGELDGGNGFQGKLRI
jgi:hypothetical protein